MNEGTGWRYRSSSRIVDARLDDRVGAEALDRVLQIDIPIVDGEGEAREEPRLQNDADRLGRRLFRLQVGIAAEQSVILRSGIGRSAVTHRHAGCNAPKFIRL